MKEITGTGLKMPEKEQTDVKVSRHHAHTIAELLKNIRTRVLVWIDVFVLCDHELTLVYIQ